MIALFNISSDKFVPHAPLRNQCAKDYFYVQGDGFEKVLQPIEGQYARIVGSFENADERQNADHLDFLRFFALLQSLRTEMAAKRKAAMNNVIYNLYKEYDPSSVSEDALSERSILSASLSNINHFHSSVQDLRCILIVNRSPIDFVTSDDPAVLTNRLHLQKLNKQDFGLRNSGAILFLPLSPKIAFACFDPFVYMVPELTGSLVVLKNLREVKAVNQFQFINAGANVYFSNWDGREQIRQDFLVASSNRREAREVVRYGRRIYSDGESETFVASTEEEARSSEHSLVHFQVRHPYPSSWPSFISWHPKPRMFDTRSAAGCVRPTFR